MKLPFKSLFSTTNLQEPLFLSFLLSFSMFLPLILAKDHNYDLLPHSIFESSVRSIENTVFMCASLSLIIPLIIDMALDYFSYDQSGVSYLSYRFLSIFTIALVASVSLTYQHAYNGPAVAITLFMWGFYLEFCVISAFMHHLIPSFFQLPRVLLLNSLLYTAAMIPSIYSISAFHRTNLVYVFYFAFYSYILLFGSLLTMWLLQVFLPSYHQTRSPRSIPSFLLHLEHNQKCVLILTSGLFLAVIVFILIFHVFVPDMPSVANVNNTIHILVDISRSALCIFTYIIPYRLFKEKLLAAKRDLKVKTEFVKYISHEMRSPVGAILVGLELIESDLLSSQDSTIAPSSDLTDHPLPQNEALLPPSDATIKTMDLFHKISDLRGISTTVIDILDDLLLYEKLERKTVQLVPTLIHPATAMESTFSQLIPSCPVLEGIAIQVTGDTKEVSSDMKLNVEESKIKLIFSTLLSYSSYDSASMKEAEGNKYVPEGGKVIEISMETIVEHFSPSSRLAKSTARKNTRSSLIFPESFTPSNPPRRSSSIALPPHPVASTLPMPIGTFRVRIKDYRVGRNAHDFDCFSSTEQSTLKFERLGHVDGAGSGFKIWIAHKFMDLHHGRVSVETFPLPTAEVASSGHETSSIKQEENKEAAVGSGLLFTIDFPLYVVENRKLKDENEEEEARSLLRDLSGTDLLTPLIAPKLRLSQIVFANVSNLLSRSSSGASSHRGSCSVAATNEYKAVDEMKGLEEGKREEVEKEKVEDVLFQQIKEEEKEEEEATKLPVVVVPIYSIKSMPSMNRVSMDAYSSNIQKRLHILIVDDSAMVRKITSKVLTQYGYSYEEAKDGDEAVEMVRKSIATPSSSSLPSPFFDVILMDQQMPNMLGTEATKLIRQDLHYEGFIFGVSGNCLDEDIALFKLNGANEVIVKPLTTTKFQEVVLAAYERFEAAQGVTVGDVQTGSDDEEEDDGVVGEFVLTPIRGNSFRLLPDL